MADMVPTMQSFDQQGQSPFAQDDPMMKLNSLAQNPLLLQYVSALGGSMGGTVAKGLDATNQQNIKAQSYMKMLQKMMAGGAKVGMDADSTTIKMPTRDAQTIMSVQGGDSSGQAGGFGNDRSFAGGGTSATPQPKDPASVMGALLGGNVNPTPSPLGNFSASDLAGLTPQDIASALTGKFTQEKIGQEGINSVFDNMYKVAQINRMNQPTEEKSTASIQEYQYAVRSGYKGTFEDWRSEKDTTNQSDYKAARDSGYAGTFMEFLREKGEWGKTNVNINTNEKKLDYQVQEARQAGMVAMDEGKEVSKAMSKAIESDTFQNRNFGLMNSKDPIKKQQYKDNVRQAKLATVQEFIDNGKGVGDWAFDHKTGRATVRVTWPNNETRTYTYELDK